MSWGQSVLRISSDNDYFMKNKLAEFDTIIYV